MKQTDKRLQFKHLKKYVQCACLIKQDRKSRRFQTISRSLKPKLMSSNLEGTDMQNETDGKIKY